MKDFGPIASDTRRTKKNRIRQWEKKIWNRYLNTHAPTRHVPILTQSLEVSKWSKTYPQDPSPQPSTE